MRRFATAGILLLSLPCSRVQAGTVLPGGIPQGPRPGAGVPALGSPLDAETPLPTLNPVSAPLPSVEAPSAQLQDEAWSVFYDKQGKPLVDDHSYSEPHRVRVTHGSFDLEADFERKEIRGAATLQVARAAGAQGFPLILDERGYAVEGMESSADGVSYAPVRYESGPRDPVLGAPLRVFLPDDATHVRVSYHTLPGAAALQWLGPEQTEGKIHPFLYTQSYSIHARSWLPVQDSPNARMTYDARVRVPAPLKIRMSAQEAGEGSFRMEHPVPPYLISLGAGDLAFLPLGPRSGVYGEPVIAARAAWEFSDVEKVIELFESLVGPYFWGRFDMLVLPPSFPYGGMENPLLTFFAPSLVAGDKSMVSYLFHEFSHSGPGNSATNASWRHFWLNEGLCVYVERRLIEAFYGAERAAMEWALGRQNLERDLAQLAPADQALLVDLKGRDPDTAYNEVPYEKGALLLRHLEEVFGRERLDPVLRAYFEHFKLRGVTTEAMFEFFRARLLAGEPELAARIPLAEWIHGPGLPASAPRIASAALSRAAEQAGLWLGGTLSDSGLREEARDWIYHEWQHFLRALPEGVGAQRLARLDALFSLSLSGNVEIASEWLLVAVREAYAPALKRLEPFLASTGRLRYLKPLYRELRNKQGRERAAAVYSALRPGYHSITRAAIDDVLKEDKQP